jgi:hypothetical protein
MVERKTEYKALYEILEEIKHLENLGIDGRMKLNTYLRRTIVSSG